MINNIIFVNMEKEKYINIFQGKTGRIVFGETKFKGLYTDEITTCNILIIEGKKDDDNNCISLTHIDGMLSVDELLEEIKLIL